MAVSVATQDAPAKLFDVATGLSRTLVYVTVEGEEEHCRSTEFDGTKAAECGQRLDGIRSPQTPRKNYYEACLTPSSNCLVWNSVLMLPDFLSREECLLLVSASERSVARASSGSARKVAKRQAAAQRGRSSASSVPSALHRSPISDLGKGAQALSREVLEERILPFLEVSLPMVAHALFGQREALQELSFAFSPHEPAVNRYTPGGDFQRHTDKCALTVNILLSDPGAFEGGGTIFWPEEPVQRAEPNENSIEQELKEPVKTSRSSATVVYPRQATALLFNGAVEHAGQAVVSGTRHVYVASFHLHTRRATIDATQVEKSTNAST